MGGVPPHQESCSSRLSGVMVIVSCSRSLWDLPLLKLCARANLVGRNQNRWLLAQTFQLRGKGTVSYLTFKKTAGRSEISTDTFIKCHHFCFSSTLTA